MSNGEAVYTHLKNAAGVSALVSDRIFPGGVLPQGAALPAVAFQLISDPGIHTLDGAFGCIEPRVQISGLAESAAAAEALGEAIRQAVQGYSGGMGPVVVHNAELEDRRGPIYLDVPRPDGSGEGVYRVDLDFILWRQEALA